VCVSRAQNRAIPSCNTSAGVMAPPLLPVGVATQLPGRYPCISGSGGGELDLSPTKTSTSRRSTSTSSSSPAAASAVASQLSPGWTDPTFCRKVITAVSNIITPVLMIFRRNNTEWLACWTQPQMGTGSNHSRDAVG